MDPLSETMARTQDRQFRTVPLRRLQERRPGLLWGNGCESALGLRCFAILQVFLGSEIRRGLPFPLEVVSFPLHRQIPIPGHWQQTDSLGQARSPHTCARWVLLPELF